MQKDEGLARLVFIISLRRSAHFASRFSATIGLLIVQLFVFPVRRIDGDRHMWCLQLILVVVFILILAVIHGRRLIVIGTTNSTFFDIIILGAISAGTRGLNDQLLLLFEMSNVFLLLFQDIEESFCPLGRFFLL
jgi:hypothetical protein